MNKIKEYTEKIFEDIKHIDLNGNEYWCARELMPVLEYTLWQRFSNVINKAVENCKNSNYSVSDHFIGSDKMINLAKGAQRKVLDYKLSRYACYLIVLNCDPRKKVIALAKTYFAIQTRKQELMERDYESLTEDEKRFYQRNLTRKGNYSLNIAARNAGVKNFDRFHNSGYKGLYNGETANDIAKRKDLRYREDILDNMCSDELIANLFRISLTEQKLKNENIKLDKEANIAHYEVGKDIRSTIIKQCGTLPENFPTPNKSLKELEKNRTISNNSINSFNLNEKSVE